MKFRNTDWMLGFVAIFSFWLGWNAAEHQLVMDGKVDASVPYTGWKHGKVLYGSGKYADLIKASIQREKQKQP